MKAAWDTAAKCLNTAASQNEMSDLPYFLKINHWASIVFRIFFFKFFLSEKYKPLCFNVFLAPLWEIITHFHTRWPRHTELCSKLHTVCPTIFKFDFFDIFSYKGHMLIVQNLNDTEADGGLQPWPFS